MAVASVLSALIAVTPAVHHGPVRVPDGAVALTAAEALNMSGTSMPDVTPEWMDFVSRNFIVPTVGEGYLNTPVVTPEQFWPFTGLTSLSLNDSTEIGWKILDDRVDALIAANRAAGFPDDPITVFGYSQSAWLAAIEKQALGADSARGATLPPTSFVMLADPVRPNGGLFARGFAPALVKWTPVVSAPTDTPFPTYDIARQYDFFADFPAYPLNLLADVNAVFGLLDHNYAPVTLDPADPAYDPNTVVQRYGDTTYYLIPSKLPILAPLRRAGHDRAADAIDPVLRVFVELGYDRGTPYGQPTPFKLAPHVDPAELRSELHAAFEQSAQILKSVPAQANTSPAAASVPGTHRARTVGRDGPRKAVRPDRRISPAGST
jgi:hypothetical protein